MWQSTNIIRTKTRHYPSAWPIPTAVRRQMKTLATEAGVLRRSRRESRPRRLVHRVDPVSWLAWPCPTVAVRLTTHNLRPRTVHRKHTRSILSYRTTIQKPLTESSDLARPPVEQLVWQRQEVRDHKETRWCPVVRVYTVVHPMLPQRIPRVAFPKPVPTFPRFHKGHTTKRRCRTTSTTTSVGINPTKRTLSSRQSSKMCKPGETRG